MKRLKGFTLVELVITIAIVIILSVISVPIYRGYVDKAKYAEGYALIGLIISAQKNYYSEYGNFLDEEWTGVLSGKFTDNHPLLGIDARGNKYFTAFRPCCVYGNDKLNIEIQGFITLPTELKDSSGKNYLGFLYNITSGGVTIKQTSDTSGNFE